MRKEALQPTSITADRLTWISVPDRVQTRVVKPCKTLCIVLGWPRMFWYTPSVCVHLVWSYDVIKFCFPRCQIIIEGTLVRLVEKHSMGLDTVIPSCLHINDNDPVRRLQSGGGRVRWGVAKCRCYVRNLATIWLQYGCVFTSMLLST